MIEGRSWHTFEETMGHSQENCTCFAEYFPFLEGLTTEYRPEKVLAERKDIQ